MYSLYKRILLLCRILSMGNFREVRPRTVTNTSCSSTSCFANGQFAEVVVRGSRIFSVFFFYLSAFFMLYQYETLAKWTLPKQLVGETTSKTRYYLKTSSGFNFLETRSSYVDNSLCLTSSLIMTKAINFVVAFSHRIVTRKWIPTKLQMEINHS